LYGEIPGVLIDVDAADGRMVQCVELRLHPLRGGCQHLATLGSLGSFASYHQAGRISTAWRWADRRRPSARWCSLTI
jgi:hypothetical protein